jgi:hypothetical protein
MKYERFRHTETFPTNSRLKSSMVKLGTRFERDLITLFQEKVDSLVKSKKLTILSTLLSKLTELSTIEISKKKSQLLQPGFLGRIRTEWPQNLQKIPS